MAQITETRTGDETLLQSLGINAQLFGFQLLNFAVVALIVWYLILKPLTRQLEERKRIIDEGLDHAKAAEANLRMSEQKGNETVQKARAEANAIVAAAHEKAEEQAASKREKAKDEVAELVSKARVQIQKDKEAVKEELKQETGALIVHALEKILGEAVDAKTNEKLMRRAIKDIT